MRIIAPTKLARSKRLAVHFLCKHGLRSPERLGYSNTSLWRYLGWCVQCRAGHLLLRNIPRHDPQARGWRGDAIACPEHRASSRRSCRSLEKGVKCSQVSQLDEWKIELHLRKGNTDKKTSCQFKCSCSTHVSLHR